MTYTATGSWSCLLSNTGRTSPLDFKSIQQVLIPVVTRFAGSQAGAERPAAAEPTAGRPR